MVYTVKHIRSLPDVKFIVATSSEELFIEKYRPVNGCPANWSVGAGTIIVNNSSPMSWESLIFRPDWSMHVGIWKQPSETKKVREKSRECHNHKPQPLPIPKTPILL